VTPSAIATPTPTPTPGNGTDQTSSSPKQRFRSLSSTYGLVSEVHDRVYRRAKQIVAENPSLHAPLPYSEQRQGRVHLLHSLSGSTPSTSTPTPTPTPAATAAAATAAAATAAPAPASSSTSLPSSPQTSLCRLGLITYEPTTTALAACTHLNGRPHCAVLGGENMEHEAGVGMCAVKDVLGGVTNKCFKSLQVLACLVFDLNAQRMAYNESVTINSQVNVLTHTFKVCENSTCSAVDEVCAPGLCKMQLKSMCIRDSMCDVTGKEKCSAGKQINFCVPKCDNAAGTKCASPKAQCRAYENPLPLVNPFSSTYTYPTTSLEKYAAPVPLSPAPPLPSGYITPTPPPTPTPIPDPVDPLVEPPPPLAHTDAGATTPVPKKKNSAKGLEVATVSLLFAAAVAML
jgi:hypothetical protein